MKKKNGFTLVELLAVIVVLAIIMIIAIPAVLEVMNQARRKSFALYATKVVTAVQNQYVYDANGGSVQGAGFYVYDIKTDLGLTSTGSYDGYVTVNAMNVDEPHYVLELFDNNYMINSWDVTLQGMPEADDEDAIRPFSKQDSQGSNLAACKAAGGDTCYTREGYLITGTTSSEAE